MGEIQGAGFGTRETGKLEIWKTGELENRKAGNLLIWKSGMDFRETRGKTGAEQTGELAFNS